MKRTPAPYSARRMASRQRGAPGAAKISPATLISSMPSPTNPLNPGSCPLPPRVTTPTLPLALDRARATRLLPTSRICSGWERAKPSSSSGTMFSGLLMNFFIFISAFPQFSIVVGRVWQDNWLPEAARVRGQDEQADDEPDATGDLGGRAQAQPDQGAEQKTKPREYDIG